MNKEDRNLHKAADKVKSDLSVGVDTKVPTGQERVPQTRPNPFDARKALFAKANAKADAASEPFDESKPDQPKPPEKYLPEEKDPAQVSPDDLARMQAEAAGKPIVPGAPEPVVASTDDYVTVSTPNGPLQVRQADLDRAGGAEMYLAQRSIDDARAALEADRVRLERDRQVLDAQRREAAEHGRAPTADGRSAAAQADGGNDDAERLASLIYSGDPESATSAIKTILDEIRSRKTSAPVEERRAEAPVNEGDPLKAAVDKAVNEMTARDYPDVCGDPVARAASYQQFLKLASDPRNKDRRVLDIARDACEWGRMTFMHPRSEVRESKRGLPPASTAASAKQDGSDEDTEPSTPAETVAMLAHYRQFGRRAR